MPQNSSEENNWVQCFKQMIVKGIKKGTFVMHRRNRHPIHLIVMTLVPFVLEFITRLNSFDETNKLVVYTKPFLYTLAVAEILPG